MYIRSNVLINQTRLRMACFLQSGKEGARFVGNGHVLKESSFLDFSLLSYESWEVLPWEFLNQCNCGVHLNMDMKARIFLMVP